MKIVVLVHYGIESYVEIVPVDEENAEKIRVGFKSAEDYLSELEYDLDNIQWAVNDTDPCEVQVFWHGENIPIITL